MLFSKAVPPQLSSRLNNVKPTSKQHFPSIFFLILLPLHTTWITLSQSINIFYWHCCHFENGLVQTVNCSSNIQVARRRRRTMVLLSRRKRRRRRTLRTTSRRLMCRLQNRDKVRILSVRLYQTRCAFHSELHYFQMPSKACGYNCEGRGRHCKLP